MKKHQSHDKLFKEVEQIKENAADLISATFPREILKKLNLESLTLESENYVDGKLSEYYSDLVYNCDFSEENIRICLLFEHKSYQPKYVEFQLLRYMLNIWERQIKNKEVLKNIIPVVFYHGKNKWQIRRMEDMFISRDKILLPFMPDFNYILTDLHDFSDEVIQEQMFKRDINKALMLLFKHIFDERYLKEHLHTIFSILKRRFEDEKSREIIFALLTYLFNHVKYIQLSDIEKMTEKTTEKGREVVMTLAEKIKEEGIEQGVKQGVQQGVKEGKLETARKMMTKGFSIAEIAEITDLSIEELHNLKS